MPILVQRGRLSESDPEILDHQDGGAAAGPSDYLTLRTDDALVRRLAVAVLDECREELQGVTVRTRIRRGLRPEVVELRPAPSRVFGRLHDTSRQLSLDDGGGELLDSRRPLRIVLGVGRALVTPDPHRKHAISRKAESPEQSGREDLAEDLRVASTVFHLDFLARTDLTRE